MTKGGVHWLCSDPLLLWDWIEANAPDTRISAMTFDPASSTGAIALHFASDDDEILFRLRWQQPRGPN